MQPETGFPSSHQLKSYVAYKCRLKLAARAVLSADAGLLVMFQHRELNKRDTDIAYIRVIVSCWCYIVNSLATYKVKLSVTYRLKATNRSDSNRQ